MRYKYCYSLLCDIYIYEVLNLHKEDTTNERFFSITSDSSVRGLFVTSCNVLQNSRNISAVDFSFRSSWW
jgi:hypothetical protein